MGEFCDGKAALMRCVVRITPLLSIVLFTACSNSFEFEVPGVVVEGVVANADPAGTVAGIDVIAVSASGSNVLDRTVTDSEGRYRFELENPGACEARIVAYVDGSPYPLESDAAFVAPNPTVDCGAEITVSRAVVIPVPDAGVDTAVVRGTVSRGGQPASATVSVLLASVVLGRIPLTTVATDSVGTYEASVEVPNYYCNNLELETQPAAEALLGVGGCSASLVDIELSG